MARFGTVAVIAVGLSVAGCGDRPSPKPLDSPESGRSTSDPATPTDRAERPESGEAATSFLGGSTLPGEREFRFAPTSPGLGRPSTVDDPDGDYELRLVDADGTPLYRVRFDPLKGPSGTASPSDYLRVGVPDVVLRAARAELFHGDQLIGTLPAGPNADRALRVENVRASVQDGRLTVSWDGGKGSGELKPIYRVEYTADGETWQTIASRITDTEVSTDRWTIPGSDHARIRVTASYGLRANGVMSPPLEIPAAEPQLVLSSPADGQTFSGAQAIIFSASAYDARDGQLTGDAITWVSNRDGRLGTGESLQTTADRLAAGKHTITLRVEASSGEVASEQVTITIERLPDLGD